MQPSLTGKSNDSRERPLRNHLLKKNSPAFCDAGLFFLESFNPHRIPIFGLSVTQFFQRLPRKALIKIIIGSDINRHNLAQSAVVCPKCNLRAVAIERGVSHITARAKIGQTADRWILRGCSFEKIRAFAAALRHLVIGNKNDIVSHRRPCGIFGKHAALGEPNPMTNVAPRIDQVRIQNRVENVKTASCAADRAMPFAKDTPRAIRFCILNSIRVAFQRNRKCLRRSALQLLQPAAILIHDEPARASQRAAIARAFEKYFSDERAARINNRRLCGGTRTTCWRETRRQRRQGSWRSTGRECRRGRWRQRQWGSAHDDRCARCRAINDQHLACRVQLRNDYHAKRVRRYARRGRCLGARNCC